MKIDFKCNPAYKQKHAYIHSYNYSDFMNMKANLTSTLSIYIWKCCVYIHIYMDTYH